MLRFKVGEGRGGPVGESRYAGDQLGGIERLGRETVRAQPESLDAFFDGARRGHINTRLSVEDDVDGHALSPGAGPYKHASRISDTG